MPGLTWPGNIDIVHTVQVYPVLSISNCASRLASEARVTVVAGA